MILPNGQSLIDLPLTISAAPYKLYFKRLCLNAPCRKHDNRSMEKHNLVGHSLSSGELEGVEPLNK